MRRLILLITLLVPVSVFAQTGLTGYNARTYQPNFDTMGIFNTIGSKSLKPWRSSLGTHLDFLYKSFTGNSLAPNIGANPILATAVTDFYYALGLPSHLSVGMNIPVIFYQRGQNALTGNQYKMSGVGDMTFSSKWCFLCFFLDEEELKGWGAAFATRTSIPTGTRSEFSGSSKMQQDFLFAVDKKWETVEAGFNVGYRLAAHDVFAGGEYDDSLLWSVATRLPLKAANGTWAFVSSFYGQVLTREYRTANSPTEAMAGFEKKFKNGIGLAFGFGERFFDAIGASHHKTFLGVNYIH